MKLLALTLLFVSTVSFASTPYAGDWDLHATGLRIHDQGEDKLAVTWCKRIPFVKEGRCTSSEIMIFTPDSDGVFHGADAWGDFWLMINSKDKNVLHYKAAPKWGSEIFLDGTRLER